MKKEPKPISKSISWLKNLFLTVCLLQATMPAFSQTKTVTGTVTDALGEPLIGASVLVQGTSNGVITNIDGKYSIQVTPENTLEFSYVGMQKQAIRVGSQSVIDVQMKDDSQMLAETVVIGYGSAKKRDLTGSITNIKGDEIANKPVVNPVSALQGKVAGLQVISNGAAGSATVRIRGANSISGNNQPLYVIDGVPIINNVKDGEIDYGNPANNINSDDIESIVVLKGANASALYGSDAANGAILITTKKAGNRSGLGISYSTNVQFTEFPNILFIRTYMAADISISSRTTKPIHLPTIPRFLTTRIFPTASIGWTAATTNVHGVCQCWECK